MVDVSQRRRDPDGRFADEYTTPTIAPKNGGGLAQQLHALQEKAQQGEYDREIEETISQTCPDVDWDKIKNNQEALHACRSMLASHIGMLSMDDNKSTFSAPAPALTEPVSWSDFNSKTQVYDNFSMSAEDWEKMDGVESAKQLYGNSVAVTYTDEAAHDRKVNHTLQGFTLTQHGNDGGVEFGHASEVREQLETYGHARVFQPLDDTMTLVGSFTLDREDQDAVPVFHEEKIVKHALR